MPKWRNFAKSGHTECRLDVNQQSIRGSERGASQLTGAQLSNKFGYCPS